MAGEMIIVETIFDRIGEAVAEGIAAAKDAEHEAKDAIVEAARGRVAVATGATRDSIHAVPDGVAAGGAAPYLEFGTYKMAAQPFLIQSVDEGETAAERRLLKAF